MEKLVNQPTLSQFGDRVVLIVTDLNGLRSCIVNDEITEADFDDALGELFDKLRAVEKTVGELSDIFYQ